MDCKTARALLDAHHDRETVDRDALQAHLSDCAECRAEAENSHLLHDLLSQAVEPAEPPQGFEHRLTRRMASRPAERRIRRAVPAFAAGIAVGLLVGVAGAWHLVGQGSSPSDDAGAPAPRVAHGALPTPGAVLTASSSGPGDVAAPNGGTLRLGPDAIVRYRESGVVLYSGSLYLDVKRGQEPFHLELPGGDIMLDEAELAVAVDEGGDRAKVEIRKGFVWVGNGLGSLELCDGQQAIAVGEAAPAEAKFASICF